MKLAVLVLVLQGRPRREVTTANADAVARRREQLAELFVLRLVSAG